MDSIEYGRQLMVAKRNDMIQNGRYDLTVQEQRVVLYTITQVKPKDTEFTEYIFDIKDFFAICGIENRNYKRLKGQLKKLSDKSWIVPRKDENGRVWHDVVRWFNNVSTSEDAGLVSLTFHNKMMPFVLELSEQYRKNKIHYTQYELKYILPMQSKFSPRLYEILKSYQQNNIRWFFLVEDLQVMLCDFDKETKEPIVPKTWSNFAEFKRRVIDPAIKEINQYTDLTIGYSVAKTGPKVTKIEFYLDTKTVTELRQVNSAIEKALDGTTLAGKADPAIVFQNERGKAREEDKASLESLKKKYTKR